MSPLVAAPILLTFTLLVSGLAKIGDPRATEDAMVSLRMPARPLHRLGALLLAPGELLLAVGLWIPIVPVQVAVAAATLALMLAYLVIIVRALGFDEPVHCSCFGTLGSPNVSRASALRNVTLSLLGVAGVVSAATGATAAAVLTAWPLLLAWTLALGAAVLLTAFTLGGTEKDEEAPTAAPLGSHAPARAVSATTGAHDDASEGGVRRDDAAGSAGAAHDVAAEDNAGSAGAAEEDELDYLRTPIPPGLLRDADGELVPLRSFTAGRAVLLIWVNPGCGPCERILTALPAWRERLDPLVAVHMVLPRPLAGIAQPDLERLGPGPMEDVHSTLAETLSMRGTPTAVLLGADGMLAGGPVAGGGEVSDFVEEIIEQLDAARVTQTGPDRTAR